MFVDEVEVIWKAGHGGNGCCSFYRGKYIPMGGPDGGDGGKGGDVILVCSPHVNDLQDFSYKPHAEAQNGQNGMGSDCYGRGGEDCILSVPPGTQVWDIATQRLVTEVLEVNSRVVILKGGKGGLGNLHFKNSVNRAPRQTTPGEPGEEGRFKLVLKTIADVGLVGFPNAGKSSLISCLTRAQPKVAHYPFTTINPSVGVLTGSHYRYLFLADIPGLIEGASNNKGLGYQFLRHIERCQALVMLLDMAGSEARNPIDDFKILRKELMCYGKNLADKPFIVVANKLDLPDFEANLAAFKRAVKVEVLPISCKTGEGLTELKDYLFQHFMSHTKAPPEGEKILDGVNRDEAL